jgi:amino acid transporter
MVPGTDTRSPTDGRLARAVRRWDLVALVVNSVVGAGIFGLPAKAFAIAGPYSLLAYVACAVPVLLIVLCFSEVSSRFKDTGGPYLYARAAFGAFAGFEVGWLTWLARLTAFAALCNLFVDYLSFFLPAVASGIGRGIAISGVVLGLGITNAVGVRTSSLVNNIFTVGKLLPLLLIVVAGLFFVDSRSYSFANPPGFHTFSTVVLLLLFAFAGFENAVIPAGEVRDPHRHMPFALLTGSAFALLLYVLIQAVCIGTLPGLATSERPLADAGTRLLGSAGAALISIGALTSVAGTMNAIMLAAPRVLFAMGEQGQLPWVVSTTNRRFKTPHVAIAVSAVLMLVLALWGTFLSAATMSTIIRLITYAVTCAALPMLRRAAPARAQFIVPAGFVVSVAALVSVAWLFSSSSRDDLAVVGAAVVLGAAVYMVSGRRRYQQQPGFAPTVGG